MKTLPKSDVPWATHQWPIFRGCSPASEGCQHVDPKTGKIVRCYAGQWYRRFERHMGLAPWGRATFHPEYLDMPFRHTAPARIFVAPMSDLFHPTVETGAIVAVLDEMRQCPQHTFIVLTKRPQRLREQQLCLPGDRTEPLGAWFDMPNVWLGVTAENQKRLDERVPMILDVPSAVHFVSIEPMLEPVHVEPWLLSEHDKMSHETQYIDRIGGLSRARINWVIAGPETGVAKRPFLDEWIDGHDEAAGLGLIQQCWAWGCPFFDKRPKGTVRQYPDVE